MFQIVYSDLHCMFGFEFNGIWNSEEDLRLLFVSTVLFHFIWKPLESGNYRW